MIDIKKIRENPELYKKGWQDKGVTVDLTDLLRLDEDRRKLLAEVEALKAERNRANDEISVLRKAGEKPDDKFSALKAVSQKIKDLDSQVGGVSKKTDEILSAVPNLAHISVPVGPGDSANQVVRSWGDPRELGFKGKDHLELAESLGWLAMDLGSKITGSGFPVYLGGGAKLQRSLISMMLDLHTKKHGYTEVWPPALVNRESMKGTGQIPKMEEDMYSICEPEGEKKSGEFFLVPTAEVPVTNLKRNDILKEEELPTYYAAYSPCFRREAGSYGKDTRGLSRVHQFEKVELVKFVKPETAEEELEKLLGDAEAVLQALELPYRVVLLGTGDLSFAAAKCYDLEVWAPVSKKWFEVSSCSMFGDFQARRMNIRYRPSGGGKPELVNTLNGSGVALARTILCLLENFQTADGLTDFPKALKEYLE